MSTVVREYTNDEKLQEIIEKLVDNGISNEDIFVLSHDDDRTTRIVNNTGINHINYNKYDLGESFDKKGDELREKLQEVGLTEDQASEYEADMDEGKVFLLVKDEKAEEYL
ncbi:pyrroline-5-carboxylate reductase [Staphylococcus auricularis]|uniref:General stress protein n=1 Tax=Staphylococcus auricularis TaxID=29379 RepID=A0AAW7MCH2_9STAP|nr:general stress protein [Staphylococcus auricularis]MBM0868240.1 general stress protein [Staphylococcus auricularis]MCE5038983.1 general stress protein [Staphylococcus auricularis]MCG7340744.1 general stress protein [Staphylococcus auricularis]MDC6327250.1 general stress protein [Staphylococcus auricularis]MDN4533040.1 general stress protein [Staphylococcus auricularis]